MMDPTARADSSVGNAGAPAAAAAAAAASGQRGAGRASSMPVQDISLAGLLGHQVAAYNAEEAALLEEQRARDQAELAMMQTVLGSVFSVRKPRDVVAGTASGLKTMTKGIGLGLAALVAQPYIGAKQSGAKGFVKGVGAGVLACTASTVTGTSVGTFQIVRGVLNTPRAIVQKARGQVWNSEQRKWQVDWYSLPEEAAEVLGAADGNLETDPKAGSSSGATGSGSGTARRAAKRVVDRSLYDLLDVAPEATEAEIRKAFYKQSLALHPDKNPDNPEATQKFQVVSDAYRVLSDEDRRRAYDDHGQDSAAAGLPKIEPVVFFAALFGSHHFEPFIGRLRLAQEVDGDLQSLLRDAAASIDEEAPTIDILKVHRAQQQMKRVEHERQVRLAVGLAKRLDVVVNASPEEFADALAKWEVEQAAEVVTLAKTPCGAELLYVVGWIYSNRARQFFAGSVLSRIVAQVEGNMHLVQSKAQLAGTVGKTCVTMSSVIKAAEKKKPSSPTKESTGADNSKPDGNAEGSTNVASGCQGAPDQAAERTEATAHAVPEERPGADSNSKRKSGSGWMGLGKRSSAKSAQKKSSNEAGAGVMQQPDASVGSEASQATSNGQSAELLVGTVVMLNGLTAASELNNEIGMVCEFDAKSKRYLVQVLPDQGLKKLKRENLVVIEAPPGFGSGGPSAGGSAEPSAGGSRGGPSAAPGTEDSGQHGQWAPGGEDSEMADAFKDCMPLFHDTFWGVTKLDIEFTLDKVVHRVLKDMSVDKQWRRKRAEVLLKLGGLMQQPMKDRRRESKAAPADAADTVSLGSKDTSPGSSAGGKKSMLTRFKPRSPWRPNAERRTLKAKACEEKQKRMEAALAMMAAGASTEDVDEMAAARAAMEAEMDAFG